MTRLLLCTDMDRTVIPNGPQPEDPRARPLLRKLCALPAVDLAYVTGRDLQLAREAIDSYTLPSPDYLIADVGTRIYRRRGRHYTELADWRQTILRRWREKSHGDLRRALEAVKGLQLQEGSRQSEVKLSYYVPLELSPDRLLPEVERVLEPLGAETSLMYSIDEVARVGLLDVLPAGASKLHAIRFLQQFLNHSHREVVFAGDSGNDLPVLVSDLQTVLVANALPEVRRQALAGAKRNGTGASLYLAGDGTASVGGNYSGGVIEGVLHFLPEFAAYL